MIRPMRSARQSLRRLLFGMSLSGLFVIGGLLLGLDGLQAWFAGSVVEGELGAIQSTRQVADLGDTPSTLNSSTVTYRLDGETYIIGINTHVISEFGLLQEGQRLTVAYPPGDPGSGVVIDWLLYHPLAPFMVAMGLFGLALQLLQLPFFIWRAETERRAIEAGG